MEDRALLLEKGGQRSAARAAKGHAAVALEPLPQDKEREPLVAGVAQDGPESRHHARLVGDHVLDIDAQQHPRVRTISRVIGAVAIIVTAVFFMVLARVTSMLMVL